MSDDDGGMVYETQTERANYNGIWQSISKALRVRERFRPLRGLTYPERKLIEFEPRCLDCARTAQDIRMEEARVPADNRPQPSIRPCETCGYSFYCSDKHFSSAHHTHSEIPYEDGQGNKSQCQINREIRWDSLLAGTLAAGVNLTIYPYNSILVKDRWDPLQGMTLEADFFPEKLVKDDGAPRSIHEMSRAIFRKDTDMLTLPLTILFALEKLNAGDDAWTLKNVLTIHFLGADHHEFRRYRALHDVFHRLPNLREIRVCAKFLPIFREAYFYIECLMCGPKLENMPSNVDILGVHENLMRTNKCSFCNTRKNKIVPTFVAKTYDDFVLTEGARYTQPDLAVAFNSGCGVGLETQSAQYRFLDMMVNKDGKEDSTPWRKIEQLLIQKNIPTLFTADNPDDALKDEQRLLMAGAKFVPGLERQRNPWGSLLTQQRPGSVRGFRSYNRWIAGGFK